MCEAETPTRDLSHRLMKIIDEQVGYLRGAVAAADAISDALQGLFLASLTTRWPPLVGGFLFGPPCQARRAGACSASVLVSDVFAFGPSLVGGLLFSCAALPGARPRHRCGCTTGFVLGPPREGRPFPCSRRGRAQVRGRAVRASD